MDALVADYGQTLRMDAWLRKHPGDPRHAEREARFVAECADLGRAFDRYFDAVPSADPAAVFCVVRTANGECVPDPTEQ